MALVQVEVELIKHLSNKEIEKLRILGIKEQKSRETKEQLWREVPFTCRYTSEHLILNLLYIQDRIRD